MTPERLLRECEWIPPQRLRLLERFGLNTVEDLLTHYPRRYEDRLRFDRFPAQESDTPVCVRGLVAKTAAKRLGGWKKLFEVVLEEEGAHALSQPLLCRWFNAHFVQKMIASGMRLVVYGKPKLRGKNICIDHPDFEIIDEGDEVSIHMNRITPIYRATEGLSQRVIRSITYRLVEDLDGDAQEDLLPKALDPLRFAEALREIHFPARHDSLARARRRLILEEFFSMQLFIAARRAETVSQPGSSHSGPGKLAQQFRERLPFALTGAQRRVIEEIRADMASERPMSRLLHGDVGSGKTVVALCAMLLAVESGCQAALMAPTQILAEQHYLNFTRWLEPLGLKLALRTGARKEETSFFNNDEPQIIVGTHALLYDPALFSNLGFIVIDEQHKFGVLQRARLIGQARTAPDVLVMTATPIPRTLTMTLYGDLDVSTLDELPANRGKIITAIRDETKLPDAVAFIRKQLEAGRQAYIVYPAIEDSGKADLKAAAQEFEKWREALRPLRCELLHGRVEPEEKEAIMRRFHRGESHALVATSVIEVGVDVPNASIMLIENAERFGLAQLHQLRGRIGRGEHKSYCILMTPDAPLTPESREKLLALERSSDGFEIAETDLRLRGPGDILGTAQSGLPPLKLGNPLEDSDLMAAAREAAAALFADDPLLVRPENKRFRDLVAKGRKRVLSQVS